MHLPPDVVGRFSLIQFNNFLHQLGKKINWDIQVAAIPGGNKLDQKMHPLAHDNAYGTQREPGNNGETLDSFEVQLRNFVRKT